MVLGLIQGFLSAKHIAPHHFEPCPCPMGDCSIPQRLGSTITRTEESCTGTGAAAWGLPRVLPWHPVHVEEGRDAAGLHCHQVASNTCEDA